MNRNRMAGLWLVVLSGTALADEARLHEGEAVYDRLCMACHQTGVAGAPIYGDEESWSARLNQEFETLSQHAIDGIGAMPPRGGNPNLSDDEVRAATYYLLEPVMAAPLEAEPLEAAPLEEDEPSEALDSETPEPEAPPSASTATRNESAAAQDTLDGEALYSRARCATCHATGIARSPKLGDRDAWGERLEQGREALYNSVIFGKGVMPPRGASTASDDELKAMVDYMIERAR
ncbi:c-type cytochrome [Halomonas sp. HNIBRBA4712]|uniref:c-type cytochrome n=1 Tax=Halomonas sp. HNIBRBA4712 TaxID=3373087 RepID=UPI003745D604